MLFRSDYEELAIIYQHLDSSTTVSQTTAGGKMPPAMGDIDFAGPAQWGKLRKASRNGKAETYELDFGQGHKVVTFVLWAN